MTARIEEAYEYAILSLMTPDTKKFCIEIAQRVSEDQQAALERLQLRDWVRLIDISPVATMPGKLFRIFRVMPVAVEWYTARTVEIAFEQQKRGDDADF